MFLSDLVHHRYHEIIPLLKTIIPLACARNSKLGLNEITISIASIQALFTDNQLRSSIIFTRKWLRTASVPIPFQ